MPKHGCLSDFFSFSLLFLTKFYPSPMIYNILIAISVILATKVCSIDNFLSPISLKFGASYITGQCGRVQSKECFFMFTYTFLAFFCCFSSKKLCFYHFHFFFLISIKFLQQNIKQLETITGDKKLSVERYDNFYKINLDKR